MISKNVSNYMSLLLDLISKLGSVTWNSAQLGTVIALFDCSMILLPGFLLFTFQSMGFLCVSLSVTGILADFMARSLLQKRL